MTVPRMTDGLARCWWSGAAGALADPRMVAYHDDEWGVPMHDDIELFERLALESFQAGLSWSTILSKREAFRAAFRGFDPRVVAAFDDADRARLMADAGIVRNRAKIDATIGNAAAFLATAAEFGSFDAYLGTMVPRPPARLPSSASSGRHAGHDARRRTRCRRTCGGAASGSSARRSCTPSCRASAWSTTTCRAASATA